LRGTFATRFNRLRRENGHIFQGRYKSLLVESGEYLGALCHSIHLNPVRAGICGVEQLGGWPWTSLQWMLQPRQRRKWYDPRESLAHGGDLADTKAGHRRYLAYLAWVHENEPARKALKFDQMSKGWVIGSLQFKQDLIEAHKVMLATRPVLAADMKEVREAQWLGVMKELLTHLGRSVGELPTSAKSADWKIALAVAMKARTMATNRWLANNLHLGNMYEVSRRASAWRQRPEPKLARKLRLSPNPKA